MNILGKGQSMDKTFYIADLVVKEYKNINEQAMEEYKQKFFADVEKLKAEKEKGVKDGKKN